MKHLPIGDGTIGGPNRWGRMVKVGGTSDICTNEMAFQRPLYFQGITVHDMNLLRPVLTVFFFLALPLASMAQEPGETFTGTVVEVTRGDTYTVRRSEGEVVTVRLFGVDTPERDQPYVGHAMIAAMKYAGGRRAHIRVEDTDRSGRVVATVSVEGSNLGRLLVREGYAWHYEAESPNGTRLAQLEDEAREAERGLWSQRSPIPPWEWRAAQQHRVDPTPSQIDRPSDSDRRDRE